MIPAPPPPTIGVKVLPPPWIGAGRTGRGFDTIGPGRTGRGFDTIGPGRTGPTIGLITGVGVSPPLHPK